MKAKVRRALVKSGKAARVVAPKATARTMKPPQSLAATDSVTAARRSAKVAIPSSTAGSATAGTQPQRMVVPSAAAKSKRPQPLSRTARTDSSVRLFQIYYEDWHEQVLDSAFEPYDNRGNDSELHEFAVFEAIAQSGKATGADYWGALSWRFQEKTGLSGAAWLAAMRENSGYDVYYCNPHPANEALFSNTWIQGEPAHPRFLEIAQAFFEAAGLPVEQLGTIQPASTFATANYFVATPVFWTAYLKFIRHALGSAERNLPADTRATLHSTLADKRGYHFGATYIPFIVERLFTVFLATDGSAMKAYKVALPEREKDLNMHLRLLREMKDVAHKTKSKWLASCWVNYRNLYLYQANGADWCSKYLRNVTPAELQFA